MMMWGGWPNMMGGSLAGLGFIWIIFVLLFALVVIAGVIILIIWALKKASNTQQFHQPSLGNALEVLKERYAKGEISKQEYEDIKRQIS